MVKSVGMFEAKTHFSQIVAAAANGQVTIVTKKGKPVAEIGPARDQKRAHVLAAMERVRAHAREIQERNSGSTSAEEIVVWIREGRRFE